MHSAIYRSMERIHLTKKEKIVLRHVAEKGGEGPWELPMLQVKCALYRLREKELIYCGDSKVIWNDVFFGKEFHDRQISRVFLLWLDREESDFTIQEEEVDSVLWMDFDECYQGVQNDLFENCIVLEELDMLRKALAE